MKDLHRISRCTRHFMVTGASSSALSIELTQLAKLMFGAWPIRYSFRRTARWASSKRLQAPTEVNSENRGPQDYILRRTSNCTHACTLRATTVDQNSDSSTAGVPSAG